jgi:hypothetical protein
VKHTVYTLVTLTITIAPKKKSNKKKKNKSPGNGDAAKTQTVEKDTTVGTGGGEGEMDDSEQSALVRVTPVQLPKYDDQHMNLTAPIRTHQVKHNFQRMRIHKRTVTIMTVRIVTARPRSS